MSNSLIYKFEDLLKRTLKSAKKTKPKINEIFNSVSKNFLSQPTKNQMGGWSYTKPSLSHSNSMPSYRNTNDAEYLQDPKPKQGKRPKPKTQKNTLKIQKPPKTNYFLSLLAFKKEYNQYAKDYESVQDQYPNMETKQFKIFGIDPEVLQNSINTKLQAFGKNKNKSNEEDTEPQTRSSRIKAPECLRK